MLDDSLVVNDRPSEERPPFFEKAGFRQLPSPDAVLRASASSAIIGTAERKAGLRTPRGTVATSKKKQAEEKAYRHYRRLFDNLQAELANAEQYLENESLADEGMGIAAEVEHILDRIYECDWGQGESLKRSVVVLQAQVNNVRWSRCAGSA